MEAGEGFAPPMIRAYETGLLATLPAKKIDCVEESNLVQALGAYSTFVSRTSWCYHYTIRKIWWKRLDSNQRVVTNGFTVRHLRPLGHTSINLVPQEGIEPPHPAYKAGPLPLRIQGQKLATRGRIELPSTDRQSAIMTII